MKIICSNCQKEFDCITDTFLCPNCGYLNPLQEIDFFSYLGVSQSLNVNLADLEVKFLNLMSKYHPDNFVKKSETEKHNADVHSSYTNRAYETLKNPTSRFAYIYFLTNGEEVSKEIDANNGSLFTEFLEYYEELEIAHTTNDLKVFQDKLQKIKQDILEENSEIDFTDKKLAYHVFVRLQYLDKIIAMTQKLAI
ncbi:MAG: Fe-S protein assembly co-chaperone HscB [Alphaproteobacteria bacterium]|nr:Fe-S protein assembly co-chaperone HscB [Alphaproteobacteria bacterium]